MNSNQFATLAEAQAIAKAIGPIGGGVRELYEMRYTAGPYPTPAVADPAAKFFFFRFWNDADGYNVGLIRTLMQTYPASWEMKLLADVTESAGNLTPGVDDITAAETFPKQS